MSVAYAYDSMTLISEYFVSEFDMDIQPDFSFVPPVAVEAKYYGWYVQGDWRVIEPVTLATGYSFRGEEFSRASMGVESRLDETLHDCYFSARWDVTPNLILKAEQHICSGTGGVLGTENPDGQEEDWTMTLFKMTFVF